jgi:hypothetical protein
MKTTCCVWCSAPVKVLDTYDDLQHKAVCSPGCKDAETLFCIHYSDEEINRRDHYHDLTKGEG